MSVIAKSIKFTVEQILLSPVTWTAFTFGIAVSQEQWIIALSCIVVYTMHSIEKMRNTQ